MSNALSLWTDAVLSVVVSRLASVWIASSRQVGACRVQKLRHNEMCRELLNEKVRLWAGPCLQPVHRAGYVIDTTVAATDLREGDVILRVPEHLVVTLNRCAARPPACRLLRIDSRRDVLICQTPWKPKSRTGRGAAGRRV